jgi:hypothetical protein
MLDHSAHRTQSCQIRMILIGKKQNTGNSAHRKSILRGKLMAVARFVILNGGKLVQSRFSRQEARTVENLYGTGVQFAPDSASFRLPIRLAILRPSIPLEAGSVSASIGVFELVYE